MITVTRETLSASERRRLERLAGSNPVGDQGAWRRVGVWLGACLVAEAAVGVLLAVTLVLMNHTDRLGDVMTFYVTGGILLGCAGTVPVYRTGRGGHGAAAERAHSARLRLSADTVEQVRLDLDDASLVIDHDNGTLVIDRDPQGMAWAFDVADHVGEVRLSEITAKLIRPHWRWLQSSDGGWVSEFRAEGEPRALARSADPDLSVVDVELEDRALSASAMALDKPFARLRADVLTRLAREPAEQSPVRMAG